MLYASSILYIVAFYENLSNKNNVWPNYNSKMWPLSLISGSGTVFFPIDAIMGKSVK